MIKLDFKHLSRNNMSYVEHARFALSICVKMVFSSVFFLIHGFMPCLQIPQSFNLSAMSDYMDKKNEERPE
tara:strand:- start:4050 stop:4262 length:213 start_codon:yes stop_codon:yes gene_type:complete